jgi:pimeloyl-ACP methyl ester carboxylesterase
LLRDRYESARFAAALRVPVVVVEADDDRVVPRVDTEALVAAFRISPKVVLLPGTGHNTVQESPGYGATLAAFLR